MKICREQVAENHRRILEAAAKLFRERGFAGVGVDAIMREAGLTHGGFYGHFDSKEDLIAQACARDAEPVGARWKCAPDPLAALAAAYLSPEHCRDHGAGCLLAALGPEVARQSGPVRRVFTDYLRTVIDELAGLLPGKNPAARREKAIAVWSGLVGTIVLARVAGDPQLSDEIRTNGIAIFGRSPDPAPPAPTAPRSRRAPPSRDGRTRPSPDGRARTRNRRDKSGGRGKSAT